MERKANMPLWVFLGLMNIETRKGALILVWTCFVFSVLCVPLSYYLKDWSWAAMMFPVTLWYWACLRWVDSHSLWPDQVTVKIKTE
ncbi:MAG: hypothetical protein OEY67_04720 [Gammaproteobacteria bacterium]|nr:hypothetical protein [Gammaproteobacteria bacterium]